MRIIEKKQVEKEFVVDVICNQCGNSCKVEPHDFYGLIEIGYTGGYCSTHFGDMEQHSFSLCEKCLRELIDKFSINSLVDNGW